MIVHILVTQWSKPILSSPTEREMCSMCTGVTGVATTYDLLILMAGVNFIKTLQHKC